MFGSDSINSVCKKIISEFSPKKLYLFSIKKSPTGEAKGFKLGLVIQTEDKADIEKQIYLNIESDIPYDLIVYTTEEWEKNISHSESFANRISQEGTCVYDDARI